MTERTDFECMPTMDEVHRFMVSNTGTASSMLGLILNIPEEDARCSNGRLRDIWKQAGGMVKGKRAWIEVDLLPGLLRLLSEIPKS